LVRLCARIVARVVLGEPVAGAISEERLRTGDRWAGTRAVVDRP